MLLYMPGVKKPAPSCKSSATSSIIAHFALIHEKGDKYTKQGEGKRQEIHCCTSCRFFFAMAVREKLKYFVF
jgi:hypothetical protein